MKRFDAVKTMRDIRTQLSERYQEDAKRQSDDLHRIHENTVYRRPELHSNGLL